MSQGNINSGLVLRKDRNLSDVTAQEINVDGSLSIESGRLQLAGQGFNVAVGYAPTDLATALADAVLALNNRPNLPVDTATTVATAAATTLILPAGAVITRAFATNNGTAFLGGTSIDIGQSTNGAVSTPATSLGNIFDAVTTTNLAVGASVGGGQGTAITVMDFADVGEGLNTRDVFASDNSGQSATSGLALTAAATFVTAIPTADVTGAGDLKVILEYLQL